MREEMMMIKKSNLYAYYVKSHNAVKVGFGDSSVSRMKNYSKQYQLIVDERSLRTWEIPVAGLAQAIESSCHQALLDAGSERLLLVVEGQESQELFKLDALSYDESLIIVAGTIDEMISVIRKSLNSINLNAKEESRKKIEELKQKKAINKKIEQEDLEHQANECAELIEKSWVTNFQPFVDAFYEVSKISSTFEYRKKGFARFFEKDDDPVVKMRGWYKYPTIKKYVNKLFHLQRKAKQAFLDIHNKFSNEVVKKAEEKVGKSLYNPIKGHPFDFGGLDPNTKGTGDEIAFLEVYLIVSICLDWGWDWAEPLIRRDKELLQLVAYAKQNLPPGFNSKF